MSLTRKPVTANEDLSSPSPAGSCPFRLGAVPGNTAAMDGRELRALGRAPVVELPDGARARAVVDHGLALRLLAGPQVSREGRGNRPGHREDARSVDGVIAAWVGTHHAFGSRGDDQGRPRAPVAELLTRRRTGAAAPLIEEAVDDALADLAGDPGVVDLVRAYALRVPQRVIISLLGVPAGHLPTFAAAAGLFDATATADELATHLVSLLALLDQLVASRRAAPGDDLVGDLIRAADASPEGLSEQELRDQLMLLVIAGTEATAHAIGTLTVHLMTHPLQRARLTAGELPWEDALEESLRLRPPVAAAPLRRAVGRFTDDETGESFEEGEEILIHFAATGRDRSVHTDPDVYDIGRPTAHRHLAFGHGPHSCPGAPLARAEVITAVSQWFRRFPRSRLAVEPGELLQEDSFMSSGYRTIPVLLAEDAEDTEDTGEAEEAERPAGGAVV
ncbi:cytochrome P450 [Streptomyces sp. LN785]|uniref:cytochrome P450 n=1 Tax=Streptomyces sp. LN785 TaxID=3112983 RepID=UPI00371C1A03